ncbi:MAG TPA: alpha/beta hydrolase [Anaerolineales bacterium]|nr:alpha/beta hydrolase [Anaerolineales bacterium]
MPKTQSKDGTTIAFETVGTNGGPLILVDGALCFRASGPMRRLAQELQSEFVVVTYDRRGRGESGNTLPYDVEREIDDIAALIDVVGGRASLFGISSGAVLALKAANWLGDRVRALALYEPPLVLDAAGQRETLEFTAKVDAAASMGEDEVVVTLFMSRVMKALGAPEEAVAGMIGTPMWQGMKALAPTICYDNHVMGNGDVPAEAATLTTPTLVAVGGASPRNLSDAARALAAALTVSVQLTVPDQTHDVNPAALAPELRRFFREHA